MKLSKQQKLYVMQYVLDNIDFTGLSYTDVVTDNFTMLVKTLKSEMGLSAKKATPDYFYVDKLARHLQGLPACLSVAFTNHDIIQLAAAWGSDLHTEGQQQAWLTQYWRELAHAIHNLSNLK